MVVLGSRAGLRTDLTGLKSEVADERSPDRLFDREWAVTLLDKVLGDLEKLSDREAVKQVAAWLMQRSEFHDGFASFITAFDERGRPYVPAELAGSAEFNQKERVVTLEEQWQREVLASGMFERRTHARAAFVIISRKLCALTHVSD